MDAAVHVDGLLKVFDVPEREPGLVAATKSLVRRKTREVRAVDAISFDVRAGRGRRLPRPQRRGQDDDAQDALGPALPDGRGGARPRLRPVEAAARVPESDHARDGEPQPAAVGSPGARFLRAQPRDLPHPARGLRPDARRAHRAARDRRPRAQADPAALPRRADEGGDRRCAPPSPAGAVPRRADDRAGRDDAEAHPNVRRRLQRAPRRDGLAHEPLHGGRRGAVQARRRDPPRPDPLRRAADRSRRPVRRVQDHRRRPRERERRPLALRGGDPHRRRLDHAPRPEVGDLGRDCAGCSPTSRCST